MIFFTICAKNFLAHALTLRESIEQFHGPVKFCLVLSDEPGEMELNSYPFPILTLDKLGIPKLEEMEARYDVIEFSTSVKASSFSYLLDQHPEDEVVYLDPDILVLSRFDEVEQMFRHGANCILTPHILEPAEWAEIHDGKFLQYGIYNLGFCAFRNSPQTCRIVSWWARRLQESCVINLAHGLFVDQKWADLFPAFVDGTVVLRHPGYNVAYWNLSQRRIRRKDHVWLANGEPLRFFHFSGAQVEDAKVYSRHSAQFTRENIGVLNELLDEYRARVYRNGHEQYRLLPYAFNWTGGHQISHAPRPAALIRTVALARPPHLPLLQSSSLESYRKSRAQMVAIVEHRIQEEIDSVSFAEEVFCLEGYCTCCGKDSIFQSSSMFSTGILPDGRPAPNWREHLNCASCGLVTRVRGALHVFQQEFNPPANADIYLMERTTRTYDWVEQRFPSTVGSEFFLNGRPGDRVNGVPHQDVQQLSFPSDSFDFILSFDVMEHVPDATRGFSEILRCLKPGGTLLFTVPFRAAQYEHEIRALEKEDGTIEHLIEPEFHGNPVDPEAGSLCYRYFGWQLLDDLRSMGYADARVLSYWSRKLMLLGDPAFVFVASKP